MFAMPPALLIVTMAAAPILSRGGFSRAVRRQVLLCFALHLCVVRASATEGCRAGHAGHRPPRWHQLRRASQSSRRLSNFPAVLPAAIATVFLGMVMFPAAVLMQELDPVARRIRLRPRTAPPRDPRSHGAFDLVGITSAAGRVPMRSVNAYLPDGEPLSAFAVFAVGLESMNDLVQHQPLGALAASAGR